MMLYRMIKRTRWCLDRLYCWVARSYSLDGIQMRQQHKLFQKATNYSYYALNELENIVRLRM